MRSSGLLVAGTSSDAGKSLVVTGLCRLLARRGVRVVPFKAQNMSNNSGVCADGAEIGRAQFLQAYAAGLEPESAMNPVLLKPGSDRSSHIVLRGRPAGVLRSGEYATGRRRLAAEAFATYDELAGRFDVIICEGAGSPTEINLRAGDYVNLGLARAKGLPVTVVGDIDRGGVLAALYGTVALLDDDDRAVVDTFVINKFRGDPGVLQPGLDELTRRTAVPVVGVLPWLDDVWLDGEDSLSIGRWRRSAGDLRIAVVALPRISNATDVEALAAEPGVEVNITRRPAELAAADLVILPGTRATVDDLTWLRDRGLDSVIIDRAERGAAVIGICGGYQMLGQLIEDDLESGRGTVPGLGLLPTRITFGADKILGRPTGEWQGHPVRGYEIHHGIATATGPAERFLDGCRVGAVWGTIWHGTFENDAFRRSWLAGLGTEWMPEPDAPGYTARRDLMIDTLADAIEKHVDVDRLLAGTRIGGRA